LDNDWNGLADLIANLITKYAGVLDLDDLPDPIPVSNNIENENIFATKSFSFHFMFRFATKKNTPNLWRILISITFLSDTAKPFSQSIF